MSQLDFRTEIVLLDSYVEFSSTAFGYILLTFGWRFSLGRRMRRERSVASCLVFNKSH